MPGNLLRESRDCDAAHSWREFEILNKKLFRS